MEKLTISMAVPAEDGRDGAKAPAEAWEEAAAVDASVLHLGCMCWKRPFDKIYIYRYKYIYIYLSIQFCRVFPINICRKLPFDNTSQWVLSQYPLVIKHGNGNFL